MVSRRKTIGVVVAFGALVASVLPSPWAQLAGLAVGVYQFAGELKPTNGQRGTKRKRRLRRRR
jgi:hypothetical protein